MAEERRSRMPVLKTGRITFLRAHDVGTAFGPPDDRIDVEAVVKLDSKPAEAYGFQLRNDNNRLAREAMFDLLRDAANNQFIVALDVEIEDGRKNGVIIRVAQLKRWSL
jgi:hypothetical protein